MLLLYLSPSVCVVCLCVFAICLFCVIYSSKVFWTFDFCFVAFERHTRPKLNGISASLFVYVLFRSPPSPPYLVPICSCFSLFFPPILILILLFHSFARNFIPLQFGERKAPFILDEIIVRCSRFNGEEINSILLNSNEFGIHLPVLFHHNFSQSTRTHTYTRAHKRITKYISI